MQLKILAFSITRACYLFIVMFPKAFPVGLTIAIIEKCKQICQTNLENA